MMIPVYSQLSCCLLLFICRTDCACCLCLQYSLFDCQNGRSLEVLRQSSISVKRVHVEAQYYIISILHLSAFREIVPIFLLPAFLAPKSLSSILFRFWRITYCSLKLNGLTKLTTILFGHCRSDLNFQQLYCLLTASIYTVHVVYLCMRACALDCATSQLLLRSDAARGHLDARYVQGLPWFNGRAINLF